MTNTPMHTHTHTHTHTPTHTQELLQNENMNPSERQVAKLRLDYQDTETARIQFKDEVHTYIIS